MNDRIHCLHSKRTTDMTWQENAHTSDPHSFLNVKYGRRGEMRQEELWSPGYKY